MSITIPAAYGITSELISGMISTIMHERSLIPESCFKSKTLEIHGDKMQIQSLLKGSHEEADLMLSNFEEMFSSVRSGEFGFLKFRVVGTYNLPNTEKTQHVEEIYNIDLDFPLSPLPDHHSIKKAIEENTISLGEVSKQFFATLRKVLEVAKSFEPLAAGETYYLITGGPVSEEESKKPVVYDHPVFAPYNRFSGYTGTRCSVADLKASGNVQMRQAEVGILNEIEDFDMGTVSSFYYDAHVWVRRVLSEEKLVEEPPEFR